MKRQTEELATVELPSRHFLIRASAAVFITYLSMYAFRKPFTAATYDGLSFFNVDYKILLILAQLAGYTLSKFMGIGIISSLRADQRLTRLIQLMCVALSSLLLFGMTPPPFNIIFMFVNGIPLGLIWGIVFSYIEGRRSTELLGAIMASSFILSSGIVKAIGSIALEVLHVDEFWMPFFAASIFIPFLMFGIFLLSGLEPPEDADRLARTERVTMGKRERKKFKRRFGIGILLSVLVYMGLTIFRDLRDNFAVEFWKSSNVSKPTDLLIYTEIPISFTVLAIISLLTLVKQNRIAFFMHFAIVCVLGFVMLFITFSFRAGQMGSFSWVVLSGFAMYLPYIGYHTFFFERWIAYFRCKSNAGFLMYTMDAAGYLSSCFILLFRNFGASDVSWVDFFMNMAFIVGSMMIVLSILSFIYFRKKPVHEIT